MKKIFLGLVLIPVNVMVYFQKQQTTWRRDDFRVFGKTRKKAISLCLQFNITFLLEARLMQIVVTVYAWVENMICCDGGF